MNWQAIGFNAETCEPTGTVLTFMADSFEQAVSHCLYTLQLKNGSASIGPSNRVVHDGYGNAYALRQEPTQ